MWEVKRAHKDSLLYRFDLWNEKTKILIDITIPWRKGFFGDCAAVDLAEQIWKRRCNKPYGAIYISEAAIHQLLRGSEEK